MLFLFNALVIGAAVLQISSYFPLLQNTVLLFVLGVISALVMSFPNLGIKDDVGVWGTSYTMWIEIDPHLFMFTLLPALLAGDAMSIDTSVARRVAYQCLYLAGPGVVISAMVTALFLQAFLGCLSY
jgi:NhaP-type Na+/H+ or K+/H+ antiporter